MDNQNIRSWEGKICCILTKPISIQELTLYKSKKCIIQTIYLFFILRQVDNNITHHSVIEPKTPAHHKQEIRIVMEESIWCMHWFIKLGTTQLITNEWDISKYRKPYHSKAKGVVGYHLDIAAFKEQVLEFISSPRLSILKWPAPEKNKRLKF